MSFIFLSNACADDDVYQSVKQPAKDFLCQDDRHLAHLQPPPSLHRGSRPHLYGYTEVNGPKSF